MKNLESTTEGQWIELFRIRLTPAQEALLLSDKETDMPAKQALQDYLLSQAQQPALDADASSATAKYNEMKPFIGPNDIYELIAVNINVSDNSLSGIINYRINGEHHQIRF